MYMLYEKSVIDAILNVVTHHECAVIADFGGFIVRRNPGLFNSFSGELKASTAIVYFNNEIKSDDGLVADALRNITGESFKTCQQILSDWVKHINNELSLKKNYSLLPLGNFHTNSSGGVFFISSPNFSIDPYSFGLPVFQWKWDLFSETSTTSTSKIDVVTKNKLEVSKESTAKIKSEENLNSTVISDSKSSITIDDEGKTPSTEIDFTKDYVNLSEMHDEFDLLSATGNSEKELLNTDAEKPSLLWQIAAAIAIVSISVSLYFTFSQLLASKKEKSAEQASMMLSLTEDIDDNQVVFVKEDKPKRVIHSCRFPYGNEGMEFLKKEIKSKDGKYYVTGGAYITEKLAYAEGLRWQKLGYDVCLLSAKNSSLIKVVLGRFNSEKMASMFVENISEMPTATISVEELTFKW